LLLIGGLGVVNTQTDIILLGILRSPTDAGVYRVASRGAEFIEFVLLAVNAPLAPMMARLYARGEGRRLQRMITSSARMITLLSAPVALGLIVFADGFLGLFGGEFVQGRGALTILAAAQLVNAFFGSVAMALTMTGHERDTLRGLLLAAVLNVSMNFAFIPLFGTIGAAIATATSIITWNVALGALLYRRLGLVPTALGRVGIRRKG
jgi:O-antigen/teichoic acid export membrane protein